MPFNFNQGWVRPNFGEPMKLIKAAAQVVNTMNSKPKHEDMKLAIDAFWRYYKQDIPMPLRSIKRLSWVFNIEDENNGKIIDDRSATEQALTLLRTRVRPNMIAGLIDCYFGCELDNRQRELLRESINEYLIAAQTTQTTRKFLQHWVLHREEVFSISATRNIAQATLGSQDAIADKYIALKIPTSSPYYCDCLKQTAVILGNGASNTSKMEEFIKVLRDSGLNDKKVCINEIIMGLIARGEEEFNQLLCDFCLEFLGDPRISEVNWSEMSIAVRDLVTLWVSEADINIFFNTVDMNSERKDFWLEYIGKIKYSRLVLGYNWQFTNKIENVVKDRSAYLMDGHSWRDCAFIIKMGNLTIVEFGQANNACYVYRDDIPFKIEEKFFYIWMLKRRSRVFKWLSHRGYWQYNFRQYFREQGIIV